MSNKYVNFISDAHLLYCIADLHKAYVKAKSNITKKSFYSNKIDTIKLTFDAKFNSIDEENLIQSEILRQIDKSINNSIGTFHEQILGGIDGFEVGNLSGFDIKAKDKTLFAIISHGQINPNIEESLFLKLADYASTFKNAKFYYVQLWSDEGFNQIWLSKTGETEYKHKSVFKISGDEFYALLSGQADALVALNKALPLAIKDYLDSI